MPSINNPAVHGHSPVAELPGTSGSHTSTPQSKSPAKPQSKQRSLSGVLCGLMPRRQQAEVVANQHPVSSAAQHLGALDGNGKFVATGKWNGPDAPSPAAPSRTTPLQHHEVQQAGYQLGARLNGTPIENADDRKNLAEATETIHQTRLDLKYGRGNIADDVRASNNESAARTAAAYDAFHKHGNGVMAGVSLALGAGNCDQHGAINARRHAATMEGGTTHTVSDTGHTYALYNAPPKPQGGPVQEQRPTIVLDSWANGPAVRLQDSVATSTLQQTRVSETFDKVSGTAANAVMEQARAEATYPGFFGHRTPLYVQTRTDVKKYRNEPPKFPQFTSSSVVDPKFAHNASQALQEKAPLHKDILAAGAARQSYNLSVAEATKRETIDKVLEEAVNLTAQDRPPIGSR